MISALPWRDENIINKILLHKTLHKKKTQHFQLFTTQSGTPLSVQSSSSRAYC